jgi:signal transduction histidine kinase
VYGITAQLVTSFVASCMIGLWISKVIEQSELRAEVLAELDATRHELDVAEQARGALAERERMAREIHDTLAQGFTSIAMLSEAAQAQLRAQPQDPEALLRSLTAISQTARESLTEARALVASGVPSDVQGGDLLAALERLPDTMRLDGMSLAVALPDSLPPLPSIQQVALLRTAQEALNNVRRHSRATTAELLVDVPAGDPPLLRLTVTDNGQGFDTSANHQGFGLKSMAARLDEIGGRLHITSSPTGTRLVAVVPTPGAGA